MIHQIDTILIAFRGCFSRRAAFAWFVVIIIGFLVRADHDGVSSIIRWMCLPPECYDPMLRFFRASSWQLEHLLATWAQWAVNHYPVIEFEGRSLLIGDGIKVAKEAHKMPGVKSLHQNSENSGKSPYMRGHHFGFVGLLIGSLTKAFCLPLRGELHEGMEVLRPAEGLPGKPATLVTRMAHLLVQAAKHTGRCCYATVDAYFAVSPMFLVLQEAVNEKGERWVHVITRAKDNTVAYLDPDAEKPYADKHKVYLMEIFDHPHLFTEAKLTLYGQVQTISYCCVDLLWKPVQGLLRFVLVRDGGACYILMSSDLSLSATTIITIYSYRAKIEVMFLFLKHLLGGFCYHFWSKALSKLKRGQKRDYSTLSKPRKQQVSGTCEAIERFVNLAAMALGILQYLSLTATSEIWQGYHGWLRTYSSAVPSEQVVRTVVQTEFFDSIGKVPCCRTLQIIQEKRRNRLLKDVA